MAQEVIDEKISCLTHIYADLLKFASLVSYRELLVHHVKIGAHLILSRVENCLLVPLSLYSGNDHKALVSLGSGFSDRQKLSSAFKMLTVYADYLKICVGAYHIYPSQGRFATQASVGDDSVMEKMIQLIMSHALKSCQSKPHPATQQPVNIYNSVDTKMTYNLGVFLWQHCAMVLLQACLRSYSQGIKDNLRRGINDLFVPNCIFSVGQSLSASLVTLTPIRYATKGNDRTELPADHYEFLDGLLAA